MEKKNPGRHFSFRTVISFLSGRRDDLPIASGNAFGISPNQERINPVIETEPASKAEGLG